MHGLDVALRRSVCLEGVDDDGVWPHEAHGEDDGVGLDQLLRSFDLGNGWLSVGISCNLERDDLDRLDVALLISDELLGHDGVLARIRAVTLLDLFLTIICPEDPWVGRPCVGDLVTSGRRLVKQLEVHKTLAAMPDGCGGTVCACVAASDDHHSLSTDIDEAAVILELPVLVALVRGTEGNRVGHELRVLAEQGLLLLAQELHGKVDVLEISTRDRKISGFCRTHSKKNRIELALQLISSDVLSNLNVADEVDSFRLHNLQPPLHNSLVQLHVGNSKHEESSRLGVPLEHSDLVAHLVQLVRSRQTRWTRSDDGNSESSSILGDPGLDPSFLETAVDDGILNVLDRHWRSDQSGDTGALAGSWANPASELREVVGGQEAVKSGLPLLLEDKLVPFRHQVVDWAARMSLTEGGSAVHAPRRLSLPLSIVSLDWSVDLSPVSEALRWFTVWLRNALNLHEASELVELGCNLFLAGSMSLHLDLLGVHVNLQVLLLVALFATLPGVRVRCLLSRSLVVKGEDLHELLPLDLPIVQDVLRDGRIRRCMMLLDVADEFLLVDVAFKTFEVSHGFCKVGLVPELALGIIDPSDTTAHSSGEVLANFSENHRSTSGHVLKPVISTSFHNGDSA
mmetsp:Transcript_12007/g.27727  ORF Transcript_12007/g.27727 Transcript_12007/m.27727 type:complete len:627 (+) Transcript_12007:1625-3505(+)